jgi:hypothetical protein
MKALYTTMFFLCISILGFGQLTITEISYNPPESGTDSLEYIELLNTSGADLDLTGYNFTSGVTMTFDAVTVAADGYVVVAVNPGAMMSVLGVTAIGWESGALTNGGETIEISDASGTVVDVVDYSDSGIWPTDANGTDGNGASIELCDINDDNNDGTNWRAATNDTGANADGTPYLGTPGATNSVVCGAITYPDTPIFVLTEVDGNGVAVNLGMTASVTATVYGVNLSNSGLQFYLINDDNDGIAVFSGSETFGYTVQEGDIVTIEGTVGQFNGLIQLNPISVTLDGTGASLVTPRDIVVLDETTESSLVRYFGLTPVDGTWTPGEGFGGFNAEFSDPIGSFVTVRIDDNVDLYNSDPGFIDPTLMYDVVGLGGQFDSTDPELLDSYQILPRYTADITAIISDVDDILDSSEVSIYPNPVSDRLIIDLTSDAEVRAISILNSVGRVVYVSKSSDLIHNTADLQNGVYTLRIRTDEGLYIKQFIK